MNPSNDDSVDAMLRSQFEGVVVDDGFSDRVMRRLPARQHRAVWPLWLGMFIGAIAGGYFLVHAPLLQVGWRDWRAGELSTSVIGMWLAMIVASLLALGWGLMESAER